MIDFYLNQTVTITPTTFDSFGKRVAEGGTEAKVRWQEVAKMTKGSKGEDVLVEAILYLSPSSYIGTGDDVMDNTTGNHWRVVKVARKIALDGTVNHIEAMLSRISP